MDLAVFDGCATRQDRIVEQARRRLAAFAPHGGAWELKDASQTGFRVMASTLAAATLTLAASWRCARMGQPGGRSASCGG